MLHKAAAAFEKLPDNFEMLNVTIIGSDENEHIGIHVTAHKPNEFFPEMTDIDERALQDYAMMAGIHMWFEKNTTKKDRPVWDYIHALDENGTEMYQGIKRRVDHADTGAEAASAD